MTTQTTLLPDVTRTDAGFPVAARVTVEDPKDQRLAADVVLDAWDLVEWPEGLLSHAVMLGTDGVTVQHYSQWTSEDAFRRFEAVDPPHRVQHIASSAPPLKREPPVHYQLYRSVDTDFEGTPGVIVIIDIEFEGPDPQRARDWVDTVIAALAHDEGQGNLPNGGLAAHFHVSLDGSRVLNYAEWESEAAHDHALQAGDGDSIGADEHWQRVRTYPGLKSFGFKRFVPYRMRTRP